MDSHWRAFTGIVACLVAMDSLPSAGCAASSGATRLSGEPLVLEGGLRIALVESHSAIAAAAADLAADLGRVLGAVGKVVRGPSAPIVLSLDPELGGPEAWRVVIAPDRVAIAGSDPLGLVYGIYAFSERCLGVDPFWFWKGMAPERHERIELAPQTFASSPARFRYRGWFINDEDLLTEFGTSGGPRTIDYPFYHQVIDYEMAERIYEALLRLGGNLIIPASFVDILNPPEAELVRRAAARGLHVSQHHVEPMGVSHFGYENFWRARGETKSFRYSVDPESVRTVWRAHAQKWREIAGDRVVWQLGMRGRGDRPIWIDDPDINPTTGGEFISRAMADQAEIVRSVDPRPNPPMTSTLFLEGAELMAAGALRFPAGMTVVFADHGPTQEMQQDFKTAPRLPEYRYGFYYHAAFWRRGPHLVQGMDPARMHRVFGQLEAKGDTHYAIINVSNVREHVLGAHTFIRTALHGARRPLEETLAEFAPAETLPFMRAFHDALVQGRDGVWLQDGDCVELAEIFLRTPDRAEALATIRKRVDPEKMNRAAARFDELSSAGDLEAVPARWRGWTRDYYLVQGSHLAALYRAAAALARDEPAEAARHVERALEIRAPLATGPWAGWYVGDKKANWPDVLRRLRASTRSDESGDIRRGPGGVRAPRGSQHGSVPPEPTITWCACVSDKPSPNPVGGTPTGGRGTRALSGPTLTGLVIL